MRKCTDYTEMIYEYIDNELDSNLLSEFEDHIKVCHSCKVEHDECMQALKLINSLEEEELPQNFKENLHGKLIKEKPDSNKKNIILFIRKKYFRTIGSIAAIFIFAIIMKGFLGNQVSLSTSDKSAAMPNVALSLSEEAAAMEGPILSKEADSDMKRKGVNNDVTINASQSTIIADLKDVEVLFSEDVSGNAEKTLKSRRIVLKVDKPENEIEKIKTKLNENGAKLIESIIDVQTTAQFSLKSTATPGTGSLHIEFLISNTEFNKALDSLKAIWGEDAITSNETVLIKVSDKINQLNSKLLELNNNIASFDKDTQNNITLNELEAEKIKIQSQIEDLRKDVEYSIMSISVEKR
jgi:hypothetical protein